MLIAGETGGARNLDGVSPRIIILGGGPCGLGAALRLHEAGYDNWMLYEASSHFGGLACSIVDDQGFTWDIGGHVVFSHYTYFDDLVAKLGPEQRSLVRKCVLFVDNADNVVHYPLQNHVHQLPQKYRWKCIEGLLDASALTERKKPRNFAEWGCQAMGPGLVEVFLRPYNEKLWAWKLEDMSATWLGERVAIPDIKRTLRNLVEHKSDESWGPNASFKYPLTGGIGAIWDSLGRALPSEHAKLDCAAVQIDPESKSITFADGSVDSYDYLINTVSLQTLTSQLLASDYGLSLLAQKLKYCSVVIVGLGVEGPEPPTLEHFHWAYFPDPEVPFFRCTALNHYSQKMCPKDANMYSLLLETSYSEWRPQKQSLDELVDSVEAAARRYQLIREDARVISRWRQEFKYGYPTPSIDRDEILNEVIPKLEELNIFSRGRFGGWKYEASNMDHSVMQGVECVDHLMARLGLPHDESFAVQRTYFATDFVNNPANRSAVPFTGWRAPSKLATTPTTAAVSPALLSAEDRAVTGSSLAPQERSFLNV